MKINIETKLPKSDALFIFVPEKKWDKKTKNPFGKLLSKNIEKEIVARFETKDFSGEFKEIIQIFPEEKEIKKVFLVGLGKIKNLIDIRKAAGIAIRQAKKAKSEKVSFLFPESICAKRISSGAILGNYEFKIGDTKKQFSPKSLTLCTNKKIDKKEIEQEVSVAESANFTRDLVNAPANVVTPKYLTSKAKELAKKNRNISLKVLGKKEILKHKMGALMGVAQGSKEEPQVIILEYKGGKKSDASTAFVGKGVCFDSGGYNLKPTGHIEDMHSDMAGAATVLGIFNWIVQNKPKANVIGVIGAVENMISGEAYHPGDIVTAMNGKTIQITNTDAEGRLVLADCLTYTVSKLKPGKIIDIATLTGAAIVALGYEVTALEGNNAKLIAEIKSAAQKTDENVWELPLTDYFREKTKGEQSDLLGWTDGVSAGSSMGAAFLENFVEKTPWCHLDLGGTAFHGKYADETTPKGATGVMIRTLCEIIAN